jgi:glycosyltransferase involved in cell wall biosynthesis
MDQPLVSILINSYNYADYLRDAIDSALAQTYAHREVIVVDDGSTDGSRELIASYGTRIIPILKPNGGQASAMNAGILACVGDVVCMLDADDYWLPGKVAHVVELASCHPRASVIYHRVQRISSDGRLIGTPRPRTRMHGAIRSMACRSGGMWPFPPTTALSFRREFLAQALPIPEESYRTCADLYLATLAAFCGEVAGTDEALAMYRVHGRNLWLRMDDGRPDERQALSGHLRRHEIQVRELNAALERLGMPDRVRLEEHLPYQILCYRLNLGTTLRQLALLTLRWPGESLSVRMKMLLRNLRKVHGTVSHRAHQDAEKTPDGNPGASGHGAQEADRGVVSR